MRHARNDILHNGMPRTFRDQKAMGYEAARFAKTQNPSEIIEILDRSNDVGGWPDGLNPNGRGLLLSFSGFAR
jgi:hypothetical protein